MERDDLAFGEYLKKLRLKRGLTLKELAELSGISPSYLSRIERGERNVPHPRLFKKLAPALNLTPRQLLAAAGYMNQSGAARETFYEPGEKEPSSLPEIIRDPALKAALEEIGELSEKEKEGLLFFLKAIKLQREKKEP